MKGWPMRVCLFSFSLSLFLFASVSTGAVEKKKKSSCSESLTQVISKNAQGTLVQRTALYSAKLIQLLKKAEAVPSTADLAEALKITEQELIDYFAYKTSPSSVEELMQKARSSQKLSSEVRKLDLQALKKIADFYRDYLRYPSQEELASELGLIDFQSDLEIIYGPFQKLIQAASREYPDHFEKARDKLVRGFSRFTREVGRTPTTIKSLAEFLDIPEDTLQNLIGPHGSAMFKSLKDLRDAAKLEHPKAFDKAIDHLEYTEERLNEILTAVKEKDGYIITSVVSGAELKPGALEALQTLAHERNLAIFVLPMNMKTSEIHARLLNTPDVHVLWEDLELSPNLRISPRLRPMAKLMNQLSSTQRLHDAGVQSMIFPGTKSQMQVTPVKTRIQGSAKRMTTGAITMPDYDGNKPIQHRTDYIAEKDHFFSALVVEKNNGRADFMGEPGHGNFHINRVEFIPETQSLTFLNKVYKADGRIEEIQAEVLQFEPHVGDTYESIAAEFRQTLKFFNPRVVVLDDAFNGHSVSPHDKKSLLSMAKKAEKGELELEKEIRQLAAFINSIHRALPETTIVIKRANHNDWLMRYLASGQYTEDPLNFTFASKLAAIAASGTDPLEYALKNPPVEMPADLDEPVRPLLGKPHKVVFLGEGDIFKVGPQNRMVEHSIHGDKGANGARGSDKTYANGEKRGVSGHTHAPGWFNGWVVSGTLTNLVLDYNKAGLSSWTNAFTVTAPDGSIQLLEWVDSEFFRPEDEEVTDAETFFHPHYPRFDRKQDGHDHHQSDQAGQLDQWNQ